MRRSRILSAGALTLALAACGSSGGSKGGGRATSSTTAATDPTVVADRKLADAALLRAGDLPGFTATKRTGADEPPLQDLAAGAPGCEFLVAGKRDGRVHLRSPRFTQGQVLVAQDVSVYDTPEQLAAQLELFRDPGIVGCLQSVYTKAISAGLPANATLGDVSVSPIAVENVGDGQFGFRVTANVTQNGAARRALVDIVGVSIGPVGTSFTFDAPDAAGLAQVETRLVPLVAQRAENAEH